MDVFEIDVRVKVQAASARAAEEFVESCLSQESSINPALEVESITTVGSVQGGGRMNYRHTHESVRDGSPAMLVHQDEQTITLVNEDGYEWTDPKNQWRPITETSTCIHCGQLVKPGDGGLLVDYRTGDWWCRANPSNGGDAAPHEEN